MDRFTGVIQQVAEEYGIRTLAEELGCSYQGLVNQLNPINDRPISLRKYWQIFVKTKDMRLVQPLLDQMNLTAIAKGARDEDCSLFDLVINHQIAAGSVAQTVRQALADGLITAEEAREIRDAVRAEIDALTALESELMEMAEPRLAKA
ncbi:phage regulatory CII family protein [Halomonas cupida]|uniref:phage regulatory CII family protein n=1 Tax=Halomonas cupida TaxID=44933 RepID=UPI0039B3A3CE